MINAVERTAVLTGAMMAVGLNETKSSEAGSDDGWDQISDSADTESDEEGCKSDQNHGAVLENHQ